MDTYALRVGNILIGNKEGEGALEITLIGPYLSMPKGTLFSITGGDFLPTIDEKVRIVKIPVCYGGKFGPDLHYVAEYNKISVDRVIELHSNNDYIVYMIGFAPGFPYLGGMSKEIAAPRCKSPRKSVSKGSVGIAGMQTGVYPISTPGGWRIIGNTPKVLFSPSKCPPSILRSGDVVRFYPISPDEYDKYRESEK